MRKRSISVTIELKEKYISEVTIRRPAMECMLYVFGKHLNRQIDREGRVENDD